MYILADIGGTKMRIAVSEDLTGFGEPVILDTPKNYAEGLSVLVANAKSLAKDAPIKGFVAGVKAVISADKRVPLTAPQNILVDWKDKPLADDIAHALSTTVQLENDTAIVGLGEATYGAGRGAPIVVYITESTGVNGVRVTGGRIDKTAQGFEIGGQYLTLDSAVNFEEMVSGAAIEKRFGKHPKELGKDNPVWEELAKTFAFGVHNSILHWSPNRVVIGGSMVNEIGISVERVAVHVHAMMRKFPVVPEIVHSSLGDFGGLWGGLALLSQKN
jgi:predicted NBD/HSP70 family sugar kinase